MAFGPSYYFRIREKMEVRLHTHGIGMSLWCILLIAQALLIRLKMYRWHKITGKLSFLIIPFVALATVNLIHFQMTGLLRHSHLSLYALALIINGIIVLVVLYILAMANRKKPEAHAKYMFATIFPMFTPVTDRLIYQFFPSLVQFAPRIGRAPIVPFYGFLLADTLVFLLIIWDWRNGNRKSPFIIVLVLLLAYHFSVFNFYKYPFWESFGNWFIRMPFS